VKVPVDVHVERRLRPSLIEREDERVSVVGHPGRALEHDRRPDAVDDESEGLCDRAWRGVIGHRCGPEVVPEPPDLAMRMRGLEPPRGRKGAGVRSGDCCKVAWFSRFRADAA
jgi:hypothetical protein